MRNWIQNHPWQFYFVVLLAGWVGIFALNMLNNMGYALPQDPGGNYFALVVGSIAWFFVWSATFGRIASGR